VGNGLGLQGAYGSAGMQQSLEELVAQRLKETLLQQQEADRAHQRQMSEGHLGLGERNIALDETRFGYQKNRDTAADEAAAAEDAERDQVIAGLPEWLQGAAKAKGVGLDFNAADMLEAPETREGADRRRVNLTKIEDDIRTDNQIRARPPQSAPRESRMWVKRNGAPMRVAESEIQPGDTPFDAVGERQQQGGDDDAPTKRAAEIKTLANDLLNDPNLSAVFGPMQGRMPTFREGTADAEAKVNRLQSLLTLDNLNLMKGVLSDSDIKILQQAATVLSNRTISDGAARAELQRIGGGGSRVDELLKKYGGG
jgi:hypothetical protein